MTWKQSMPVGHNLSWVCSNGDRLIIEDSERDVSGEKCGVCGELWENCECYELWVYSDEFGECDSIDVAKDQREAMEKATEFMRKYPNGWFELKVGFPVKVEFVFR